MSFGGGFFGGGETSNETSSQTDVDSDAVTSIADGGDSISVGAGGSFIGGIDDNEKEILMSLLSINKSNGANLNAVASVAQNQVGMIAQTKTDFETGTAKNKLFLYLGLAVAGVFAFKKGKFLK